MFNWLKKLFGGNSVDSPMVDTPVEIVKEATPEPLVLEDPVVESPKPKKAKSKKSAKKVETVDLDSLNKTQLLEEAKKRGVKANASLKKEEIVERIKNAD